VKIINVFLNVLFFACAGIFIATIVNVSFGGLGIICFLMMWLLTVCFAVAIKYKDIEKPSLWDNISLKNFIYIIRKWNVGFHIITILIFVSFFLYQRIEIPGEQFGVVDKHNEEYRIYSHGQIIREIDKKEYDFVQNRDLRDIARYVLLGALLLKLGIGFLSITEEEQKKADAKEA